MMLLRSWLQSVKTALQDTASRWVRRRTRPRQQVRRKPMLEALEDRLVPAYVVTTTADSGAGSLRDAITQINHDTTNQYIGSHGIDEIDFNITAASNAAGYPAGQATGYNSTTGVATITPGSVIPDIIRPVYIDGYTQGQGTALAAKPNDLPVGDDAQLKVVVDGSQLFSKGTQFYPWARPVVLNLRGGNTTLRGLVVNNCPGDGIAITTGGNTVEGCFIGTDATGTSAQGNGYSGVEVLGAGTQLGAQLSGSYNQIGMSGNGAGDFADRNIISGNGTSRDLFSAPAGVRLNFGASHNVVAGNYIGTDASGTRALGNFTEPVEVFDSTNEGSGFIDGNRIGGDSPADVADGNILAAGTYEGIAVGGYETNNTLYGNYIGTNFDGATNLGNAQNGVLAATGTQGLIIEGNVFAYNGEYGVAVEQDTVNGPNFGSTNRVQIEGNSIHDNATLGIGLGGTFDWATLALDTPLPGALQNDSHGHSGPNNFQNFPTLTTASSSSTSTTISGSFSEAAEPNTTLTLDFYANTSGSATTYGQGQTYLGSRTVVTDNTGNVSFTAAFALATAGQWISATATDQNGNTSEFSLDVQAASAPSQTFTQSLSAALPQSTTSTNTLTIQANTTTINDVVTALSQSNLGSSVVSVSVYLNLAPGTYTQSNGTGYVVSVPTGMTLYINGTTSNQVPTTIDPASPAFTVASGNVVVSNVTFVTTGDAPTILVTGGNLTLRNDIIQESTGSNDAAISVTGGTVDLGTSTTPGGNTININGAGTFISNTTASPISAVGDTFKINGLATAWPIPLTVTSSSSLMLAGNSPPPLTGSVNGTPFTGSINYQTPFGDTVTVTLGTTATAASPVGQYAITASLSGADAGNYVLNLTAGTMDVVSLGPDPSSTTGAQAVTFWDNKGNATLITAADLSSLDALNLVNQGGADFDPKSVAQLQAWLSTSPNATTAYQLAVQLAALDLNILAGNVHATDLVYAGGLLPYAGAFNIAGLTSGGFIDVQDLMNAANAVLAQVSPGAPANDPNQAYEAVLTQVLQAVNGNTDFVQQELLWNLFLLYPSLPPAA